METLTKSKGLEALDQALETLVSELETGNFVGLQSYLKTVARFRKYSWQNQMLIASQAPYATRVAGFHTWKSLGRSVMKGEKGIAILAPMVGKDKEDPTKSKIFGFKTAYVFDISQTEGVELPVIDLNVSGEALEEHIANLQKYLQASLSIAIDTKELPANVYGSSSIGTITLNESISSTLGVFNCLVHEAAHEILHNKEDRLFLDKAVLETEAESVAYIVLSALGYSKEDLIPSANYVAIHKGMDNLKSSLARVRECALTILSAVEMEVCNEEVAA